jgi:cellobiose phosphorylase
MPNNWAVISGAADEHRAKVAMGSVTKYLLKDYGTLLNYPAFTKPRPDVGYVTRYAPGLRENGGVYTHAAAWSVWAYTLVNQPELAYEAYRKICPPNRSADIDTYTEEPYVVPGNIDGPLLNTMVGAVGRYAGSLMAASCGNALDFGYRTKVVVYKWIHRSMHWSGYKATEIPWRDIQYW